MTGRHENALPATVRPAGARSEECGCDWTPSFAECVAKIFGLAPLSELQWRVISECREECARSGEIPGLTRLAEASSLSVPELDQLFPGDRPGLPWILAGLPPPNGIERSRAAIAVATDVNRAGVISARRRSGAR